MSDYYNTNDIDGSSVDALVVTDRYGVIRYYNVYNNDYEKLRIKDPLGKHILNIHPYLTKDTSTIMRVLSMRKPVFNEHQHLKLFSNEYTNVNTTTLPIKKGNDVIGVVDILNYIDLKDTKDEKDDDVNDLYGLNDIITNSRKMLNIKERILKVSKTDSPVLIYGETGTGKELIAQSIHRYSLRKNKLFVAQNCSAIPFNLMESTFFGTVKGGFTGAENTPGLFEIANKGTILLDEINSMDIAMQSKLLRVLENKTFRKVGDYKSNSIDLRVISTTNEDLMQLIEMKKFRSDLFYRLGVVQFFIPPLRERREDIPILTRNFINIFNNKMNRNVKTIEKKVIDLFMDYSWEGNIRELKNVVEAMFNFSEGDVLRLEHLPDYVMTNRDLDYNQNLFIDEGFSLNDAIEEYEKTYLSEALKNTDTLNEAAKVLKISRQTLKYKMEKHGLMQE